MGKTVNAVSQNLLPEKSKEQLYINLRKSFKMEENK
jgi:hypothetical protein